MHLGWTPAHPLRPTLRGLEGKIGPERAAVCPRPHSEAGKSQGRAQAAPFAGRARGAEQGPLHSSPVPAPIQSLCHTTGAPRDVRKLEAQPAKSSCYRKSRGPTVRIGEAKRSRQILRVSLSLPSTLEGKGCQSRVGGMSNIILTHLEP